MSILGGIQSDVNAGYTGAYVFANVLLTVAGSVILLLWGVGWFLLVLLIVVEAWGSVSFMYHGGTGCNYMR